MNSTVKKNNTFLAKISCVYRGFYEEMYIVRTLYERDYIREGVKITVRSDLCFSFP